MLFGWGSLRHGIIPADASSDLKSCRPANTSVGMVPLAERRPPTGHTIIDSPTTNTRGLAYAVDNSPVSQGRAGTLKKRVSDFRGRWNQGARYCREIWYRFSLEMGLPGKKAGGGARGRSPRAISSVLRHKRIGNDGWDPRLGQGGAGKSGIADDGTGAGRRLKARWGPCACGAGSPAACGRDAGG